MDAMLQAAAAGAHAEPFALSGGLDEDDLDDARRATLSAVLNAIADNTAHIVIRTSAGIGTSGFLQLVVAAATSQAQALSVARPAVFDCRPNTSAEAFTAWYAPVLAADGPRLLVLDDAAQLDAGLARRLCQAVRDASGGPNSTTVVRAVRRRAASRLNAEVDDDDGFPPAALSVQLAPLTTADVADLVRRRLAASGYHGPAPFTEDALDRVAYFGKGNPERVLRLCHHTFALALRDGDLPVTAPVVKSAAYELFLPSHLQKLARGLAGQGLTTPNENESWDPAHADTDKIVGAPDQPAEPDLATTDRGSPSAPAGRPPEVTSSAGSVTVGTPPSDRPSPPSLAIGAEVAVPRGPLTSAPARANRTLNAAPAKQGDIYARLPTTRTGRRWVGAAMLSALVVAAVAWFAGDDNAPLHGQADGAGDVATPDGSASVGPVAGTSPAVSGAAPGVPDVPLSGDETASGASPEPAAEAVPALSAAEPPDLAADIEAAVEADDAIPARLQRVLADRPRPRPSADADTASTREDRDVEGAPGVSHDSMDDLIAELTDGEDATEAPAGASDAATPPAPPPQPTSSPLVADAQTLLAELGYGPGPVDGLIGPRTRAAVRAFQRDEGAAVDGRITDSLVQRLRARKAAGEAVDESRRGRGLWSMLGFDLDSIHAPDRFYRYCRDNPDTWVYDHGKGRFVYCERFNARR